MTSSENAVQRYFRYFAAYWCLESEKTRTAQMVQICWNVGCGLDLVPQNRWAMCQSIEMNCVLPGLGKGGMWEAPFFPGMAKPSQKPEVQKTIIQSLTDASVAEIPQVIIFAGKSTGKNRDDQFRAIVTGLTEGDDQDPSVVNIADAMGRTMVTEALNTKGDGWYGHKNYLCRDPRELQAKVIEPVGSARLQQAIDFYHVDMGGFPLVDVVQACAENTAGLHVAGRRGKPTDDNDDNRGPLDHAEQQIPYADVMAEAAKVLPQGTPVLLEFMFPKSMRGGDDEADRLAESLSAAIEICESKTPKPAAAEGPVATDPPEAPATHVSPCAAQSGG